MKFNNRLLVMSLTAASTMAASAAVPAVAPSSYGQFTGKTTLPQVKKVQAFHSTDAKKNGPAKVQAYANDGNAMVDQIGTLTLLEEEDFSRLTTGSEEEPDLYTVLEINQWLTDPETGDIVFDDMGNIVENPDYNYPWDNMKPEYISGDGRWGVGNAYPAGGMLYFPFSEDAYQGKISTPWIDLSANNGTFVLEFKVKVTEEAKANPDLPPMIIVETAETNNMSPTWSYFEETFLDYEHLSTEWTTFRLLYQGAGPSTLCNIVGQGIAGGMFIDDVRLYSLTPYLATPVLRRHSDFTDHSFVLNWNPVEGAEKYMVNIWYEDLYGNRVTVVEDAETIEPHFKTEGTNLDDIYFYTVQAVNSEHKSLTTLPRELFDIITPKMKKAVLIDEATRLYEGGVEEVLSAFGYNYFATARRTAETDGPFVVTDEKFTGWTHPLYEEGWNYTKENPVDDKITSLYYPTDINQQGWYGSYFMIYKDYICLCPFFYEATYHRDMAAWVSPEFDLSKDGGRISVSMKLAGEYDYTFENYPSCAVALFNWNEELGDYEQVELVYCRGVEFDWKDFSLELTKGSDRSKIGFFAIGSYGDLYMDDILITQQYKAGETFDDPFFFNTWQLAEQVWDPTTFEFEIPERVLGNDIYQRAQAVRMHVDGSGAYDGEVESGFAGYDLVAAAPSGVRLVECGYGADVKTVDGTIFIGNPAREQVCVVSADGMAVMLGDAEAITHRPAAKGVYMVKVGASGVKVVI